MTCDCFGDALRMTLRAQFSNIHPRYRGNESVPAYCCIHAYRLRTSKQEHGAALDTVFGVTLLIQIGIVDAHVLQCDQLVLVVASIRIGARTESDTGVKTSIHRPRHGLDLGNALLRPSFAFRSPAQ